ncbi:hypothetical protein [Wukongibacter sp. M2B1]|uniref:hypothetical protein n=1 Tax=Wukongibacter sp. M2B1 TaxID=3088895 RepID=UPI003D78B669
MSIIGISIHIRLSLFLCLIVFQGMITITNNNVVRDKTRLYLLAQIAVELVKLSEKEKGLVVERAYDKDSISLKGFYDTLNDYMGCKI